MQEEVGKIIQGPKKKIVSTCTHPSSVCSSDLSGLGLNHPFGIATLLYRSLFPYTDGIQVIKVYVIMLYYA